MSDASTPLVILLTGPPCSGKTTIGLRIAEHLKLPYYHKDGFKELLFENLGWSDRPWSRQVGRASMALLFYCCEVELRAGRSLILEANFDPTLAAGEFQELQHRCPARFVQIQCVAAGEELIYRFRQRWESGQRHPGHVDDLTYAEIAEKLRPGRLEPIAIAAPYLEVDTTDFASVDLEAVVEWIGQVE